MERNVKIGEGHYADCYIIEHENGGFSCYGFDNTLDEIERIVIELVGRGVLPERWLGDDLESLKQRGRGKLGTYDVLMNMRESLKTACEADGERAVAGLTPQLMGLEGHRVEVRDEDGESRRFIVGKSSGWMPCHLEIARRTSSGGSPARREYRSVHDLGPVR